jgi:hypothetical protein
MPMYIFSWKNILWVVIKLKNSNVFSFKWIVILYIYLLYMCTPLKEKKKRTNHEKENKCQQNLCYCNICNLWHLESTIFDTTNMLNGGWLANTIASLQRD